MGDYEGQVNIMKKNKDDLREIFKIFFPFRFIVVTIEKEYTQLQSKFKAVLWKIEELTRRELWCNHLIDFHVKAYELFKILGFWIFLLRDSKLNIDPLLEKHYFDVWKKLWASWASIDYLADIFQAEKHGSWIFQNGRVLYEEDISYLRSKYESKSFLSFQYDDECQADCIELFDVNDETNEKMILRKIVIVRQCCNKSYVEDYEISG